MNFLICSRVSIPAKDRTLPAWEYLRSLGHTVVVEHPDTAASEGFQPDVMISMGVTIMDETFAAVLRYPEADLYCYNWDCYEWVWKNPRPGEYDYKRYGELLKLATEVWVPSKCTALRTTQWWSIPANQIKVILCVCPWWDYEDIKDEGYALCTLRKLPDLWCDVFEECCDAVGIPWKRPDHSLSYDDYQKTVAHCRFLVNHYHEASTGGLTLMEGYYLGKPCLCSDSEWNGARDYMGDRATYFHYPSKEDFKHQLQKMYENAPYISDMILKMGANNWVKERSDQQMIDDMLKRVYHNKKYKRAT